MSDNQENFERLLDFSFFHEIALIARKTSTAGEPSKNIKNPLNVSLFPLKIKIQKQILLQNIPKFGYIRKRIIPVWYKGTYYISMYFLIINALKTYLQRDLFLILPTHQLSF